MNISVAYLVDYKIFFYFFYEGRLKTMPLKWHLSPKGYLLKQMEEYNRGEAKSHSPRNGR